MLSFGLHPAFDFFLLECEIRKMAMTMCNLWETPVEIKYFEVDLELIIYMLRTRKQERKPSSRAPRASKGHTQ